MMFLQDLHNGRSPDRREGMGKNILVRGSVPVNPYGTPDLTEGADAP
jgi:hypothetical protein